MKEKEILPNSSTLLFVGQIITGFCFNLDELLLMFGFY